MSNKLREIRGNWSTWIERSTNRKIFQAALTVGLATIVVRGFGMVKEIAIAQGFGVSELVDSYLIAMIIPSIAINSVAATFSTAIVPAYVRVKDNEGPDAAGRLFSSAMIVGSFFLLVALTLFYAIGPALLALISSKYSSEIQSSINQMFRLLLPMVFMSGIRLMLSAVINAEKRFTTVALVPIATSIVTVITIVLFASQLGAFSIVFGFIGGAILELAIVAWTCHKHSLPILPRWSGWSPDLKIVARQSAPLVVGSLLLSANGIVDQAMAATLGSGSVAALAFGNKVVALFVGLGTTVLATATLPYFSDMVAGSDWAGVRHTLKVYVRLLVLVTVPATALLFLFSDTLIALIFERGAFSSTDTILVGRIQAYYILQVPFHVIAMLAVRLIIAMERNNVLMWGTIISVILNVTLNYVFMQLMGVAGIALSTACVYVVSFIYLWSMLRSFLPKADTVVTPATD